MSVDVVGEPSGILIRARRKQYSVHAFITLRKIHYVVRIPPSTGMTVPEMKFARSEARKTARSAISAGAVSRPSGIRANTFVRTLSVRAARVIAVSAIAGAMALTV